MKRILLMFLTAALVFGFFGCSNASKEASEKIVDAITNDNEKTAKVNYEEDAYDLMGIDDQAFLEKYDESMIESFLDQDSAGTYEADYYYVLNNGVEVSILNGTVVSIRTYYNKETEYPVPVLKGIGGGDSYDSVVNKLGEPHYEAEELAFEEEQEYVAAVFYVGKYRYLKVYFEKKAETVSFVSCFYGEAPVFQKVGEIKIGDNLEEVKAAYEKLYYAPAYYDASQGEPKYNRIYYTPMEDRNREVECLEFYLYDKKVVRITSSVQDILEWRSYEDIFGMKNVFKENNMIGHRGNITYFYDDAAGNEQVLLKMENCATEEIDIDDDGITEIIAYKAGKMRTIDIYDYNADTETIMHLDICEALGASWSGYMGNAANVRNEYAKCIEAGFYETDGTTRTEVYSVRDNILTYIGPYSHEMFQ